MASTSSYRPRNDTDGHQSMYSAHSSSHREHDLEPDLVPSSSSSSSSSSKSSRRRELQRQMEELDRYTDQARISHGPGSGGDRLDDVPHQQRRSSAGRRGSGEQDMIMRGADIVRAELHAGSSRRETESVHRGASIVREQIMMAQNGSPPSASSPRGVSSPFGSDGAGAGTAGQYGHRRHGSLEMHQESKRILEEVDELSDRLQHSVGFDRQETRQANNTSTKGSDSSVTSSKYHYKGSDSSVTSSKYQYKGSDSSVTSSKSKYHYKGSDSSMTSSKYHYHFDPFADEDGVDDRMTPPPAIREGPQVDGTFTAGRDNSIRFKVEDDGGQQAYESILYEGSEKRSPSFGVNDHYQEGYRHEREQVPTYGGSSMYDGRQVIPMERSRPDYPQQLRQRHPSSRPRSSGDKAYDHAMKAGLLWQTLVGEHVRFPKHWWGGARIPTLGDSSCEPSKWWFISRHRVRGNGMLNGWVRNRTSAGRLLLHVIVSDSVMGPVQDIAIGCFHPNARGIRRTTRPILDDENVREIWMAIRKRERSPSHDARRGEGHDLSASLLNTALTLGHGIEDVGQPSPLGERYSVTNDNMRAVFGDKPPLATFDVPSQELYKIIIDAVEESRFRGQTSPYPARTILQEFLFTKRR